MIAMGQNPEEEIDCKTISREVQGESNVLLGEPYEFSLAGTQVRSFSTGDEQKEASDYLITQGSVQELLGENATTKYEIVQ